MRVRFLEPVHFEGNNYLAGEEYNLSEQVVAALGSSVEPVREPEADAAPVEEGSVDAEQKNVDAAPVDKMVKAPKRKK